MRDKINYTFSIIIPTYNEANYISNCLDSILNQNYDLNLVEVIIVDGSSTDNTLDIIDKFNQDKLNIKLFHNPKRKTPIALNIGIKNAAKQIVIILGAHTKLDKDFLFFNNKYLNEKDVMATGGTQINIGTNLTQNLIGLVMEIPFAMASARYRWSKKEQYVDTVVYAAYKKEVFEKIGYFEENFTISEDAEINWRIRKAGYKIYYSPNIKSFYYPRNSVSKFIQQMFRYGILRVNVLKKHKDAIKLVHLIPSIFVAAIILLFVLGFFNYLFIKILIVFLIIYFILNIVSSLVKLFPNKLFGLPFIPFLIFLLHFSWGLGFWVGLLSPKSKNW